MNEKLRRWADSVGKALLDESEYQAFEDISFYDEGHGYDLFGFEKETGLAAFGIMKYVYKNYFRVESFGQENIPKENRGMLVCNHSGVLPIDAGMIVLDCVLKLRPPRMVRAVVDRFFMSFPYVGQILRRLGQINGMKRDFEEVLRRDELTLVFPEGTRGNGKHFSQRYKLQHFNVGFLEIALKEKAPIIPTCVIGSEEQAPILLNIKPLAKMFGFPFFPVTPTFPHMGPIGMIPLPVRYRIYYGERINLHEEYDVDVLKDSDKVRELVEYVKGNIQGMIDKGLEERVGIFV